MISIIIPAFNESQNLQTVIPETQGILESLSSPWEIIVVDDHSNDGSFEVLKKNNFKNVRCLRLSRRSGSHIALRAGLKIAKGDCAIALSADGQDNPAAIPSLLVEWKKGSRIVWALRKSRTDESLLSRMFTGTFYSLLRMLTSEEAKKIALDRADFYLVDRKVIDALNSCPEQNTSLFGLIAWIGFTQTSVDYDRRQRISGRSKWNLNSKLRLATDWIVAFSGTPLKIILYVGLAIATLGFLYALAIVINALTGNPVAGWSSTILAVLVLGGIQMCMLGVIGEYILRNLNEARRRPLYFIEDSKSNDTD